MDGFGMKKMTLGGKVDLYIMPDFPPELDENLVQKNDRTVVGKHEKTGSERSKPERERLFIGCRPVSIPPLNGPTQLQILAAEEIRKEALRSFKSALQGSASEQQMRTFLTLYLLKNLQANTWLERASVTDWGEFWNMTFCTYLQTRSMKKWQFERE